MPGSVISKNSPNVAEMLTFSAKMGDDRAIDQIPPPYEHWDLVKPWVGIGNRTESICLSQSP